VNTHNVILVCGDRKWTDRALVTAALARFPKSVTVIHGGAKGADTIAGEEAARLGMNVAVYNAEWERYGRGAGPIRNERMLKEGRPHTVLAFHDDLANSKGTASMLRLSLKDHNVRTTWLFSHAQPEGKLIRALPPPGATGEEKPE